MRIRLILALLTVLPCQPMAQTSASVAGEDTPLRLSLEALPEPPPPFEQAIADAPGIARAILLPALPDVDVAIPDRDNDLRTGTLALRASPAPDGLQPPDLPEVTVEIPHAAPAPQNLASAPASIDSVVLDGLLAPVLPSPADPGQAILASPETRENWQVPSQGSRTAVLPAPKLSTQDGVAAAALASLSPERLEQALIAAGRLQGLPQSVNQSVREFYEKRGYAALWASQTGLTASANALLAVVSAAEGHGLAASRFRKLQDALAATPDAEMREAALSIVVVAYARDARGARLNPLTVSKLITATPDLPDATAILASLAGASDPAVTLEAYHPRHAGYAALRRKLAELANPDDSASASPKLTFGPVLTLGMSDARVPILRDLLALPVADLPVFDAALAEAVRSFQRERGLRVSGRLDRATTTALGGISEDVATAHNPRADIIANMERWRWLPVDLGADHILVNIPDYSLALMRDGAAALRTRVIVGKPETQTPVFSHRMQFVVVNPSWNVPPSIALKEYLPMLQKNPQALSARGLQVVSNGRVVDPASVDWSRVGRTVAIRQPPGERNALGNIKFMFPNQHAVYLHDTPNRSLFANERRAYSHGCVRVQDPFRLAEAIMGPDWSERRLRSMVGGGERQINLNEEMPVHLAYFTSFVDETGSLQTRADLYGHNRRVKALLGL